MLNCFTELNHKAFERKSLLQWSTSALFYLAMAMLFLIVYAFFAELWAQAAPQQQPNLLSLPKVQVSLDGGESDWVGSLRILAILTLLTIAPGMILTMTSFTRLVIVFSFMRQAIGTQQSPPNQVLIALSLFLTVFIMQPVWSKIHKEALEPYVEGTINQTVALEKAIEPIHGFLLKHTREKDLSLFISASGDVKPQNRKDIKLYQLIPAFVTSELKTAFQIGFMIYVPFLILDMVVAAILMSMGMMMLPPVMISLPFKLMLFVLVDGWNLLIGNLIRSYQV